jgi:hypothetical protein
LRAAGPVFGGGPEARRVGGQRLVDEKKLVVGHPELELRVGDDDPPSESVFGGGFVEGDGRIAHLRRPLLPHDLRHPLEGDVLVVPSLLLLRRRRKDRLREAGGLREPLRQGEAAHLAVLLVFGPAGPGEISADDALDRKRLGLAAQHRAALQHLRVCACGSGKLAHIDGNHVIGNDLFEPPEPERGNAVQYLPFPRDPVGHHHVERGEPVGGHQEEPAVRFVDVPHLAAPEELHSREIRLHDRLKFHVRSLRQGIKGIILVHPKQGVQKVPAAVAFNPPGSCPVSWPSLPYAR